MVYSYTPTYYSSFQDTITSLCKTILPFSLKKRRLTAIAAAEQSLSKQQAENLKWQQESFHKILNMIGLQKEGILPECEVSAFRSQLLETLSASPFDLEPATIIRDKLQFLQELLYAKCISEDEYHASKRPLLQRLAVQGAEIHFRDVTVAGPTTTDIDEEWSVIDIRDEHCLINKDSISSKSKAKHRSPLKQIKGAMSVMGTASPNKPVANMSESFKENSICSNKFTVLMPESSPPASLNSDKDKRVDKTKKKSFRSLFISDNGSELEEKMEKAPKKQWSLKKWKKSSAGNESTVPYLPPGERSDDVPSIPCELVASPIGEGPNTKLIKTKLNPDGSASDFFIDKVLGENIKKELSRIQGELSAGNHNICFSNEHIEAISTRLPVDKADLKKFFPKSWCDRYGEIVLDVVRKEFKGHVVEMENSRNTAKEKQNNSSAFDGDSENYHPNHFSTSGSLRRGGGIPTNESFENNPFYDDKPESAFFRDLNQNPFWNSSTMG